MVGKVKKGANTGEWLFLGASLGSGTGAEPSRRLTQLDDLKLDFAPR